VIGVQALYILQTRRPGVLQAIGIEETTHRFFSRIGLLASDPLWELSREEDRTRLKQALKSIDRYSTYLTEDQFKSFSIDSHQEYEGIGVSLQAARNGAEITDVFHGSPAELAGIEAGDVITRINHQDVSDWNFNYLVEHIRGTAGSVLNLGVIREGSFREFTLRRDSIDIPSIRSVHKTDEGYIYIKIDQFGEKTAKEFLETLRSFSNLPINGLVIDLRENTGGVFQTSLDMLDAFYDRGEIMLETRNTDNNRKKEFRARRANLLGSIPTIVLVNRNSASASEILAGSLQVTGKALIIGEKTLGKGSIQTVYRMRQGDGYKKTTSHYYLPDGSSIDGVGLEPDIHVDLSDRQYFAFRLRDQKGLPPYAGDTPDPYWTTALKYLSER